MTFTPIAQGTPHWDTNVNAAFQDLQDQETAHATGTDPHGDRAYADTHFLGGAVAGTAATGRALAYDGSPAWRDSLGTGAWIFNVRSYGAKGDGKVVLDGAINVSTSNNTLTCATSNPFTAADIGKPIQIKGAASANVTTLVTTIASVNSPSTVTLAAAATTTVTNAQVMWGTDDTVAIQAAIDAAYAWAHANSGAATIFFPGCPGYYVVAGALKTGGSTLGNAQLTLPVVPPAERKIHLTFLGTTGGTVQHWKQDMPHVTGAVVSFGIFSSDTAQSNSITANGNPSILSGPLQPGGYGTSPALLFSNMQVTLRDLTFLTSHSSHGWTYSVADFSGLACASLERVSYGTNGSVNQGDYASEGQFSAGLSMGLVMPANGGNDDCYVDNVVCGGGYTWGFTATEHTVINRMVLLYCWVAMAITGSYNSGAGAGHAFYANQLSIESCTNCFYIFGQGAAGLGPFLDFAQVDTEIGSPAFLDNNSGAGITALLGTVRFVGLFNQGAVTVGGFPTGLRIIDGQQQYARTVTTSQTLKVTDETVLGDATSGAITITLISALRTPNKPCFRNVGTANNVTLAAAGTQKINGSATLVLTPGQTARLVSDGANWFTV